MPEPPEERTAIARASSAVARVTSVAIGMILPGFLGYWIDQRADSFPWLTVLGFAFGLWFGFWRLAHLVARRPSDKQ